MAIAQVRRLVANDERIGMGFNSQSGLAVGTALEGFQVTADPDALGQTVFSSVTMIESHEELMSTLGMSFEAEGRYAFYSGAAKMRFVETASFNSTSSFLVAQCRVQNPLKRGVDFQVSSVAKSLLDTGQMETFNTAFGDSFVRGVETGGEFFALIRLTSVSQSTQIDLTATLQGEANFLIGSGSFAAAFQKANSSQSTRSEFEAIMYQNAGLGALIAPVVTVEEVISRLRSFPQTVVDNPSAYEVEIATYDTLPLPVPTVEEQEALVSALRDARSKKLRYLQTRNDLDFARLNPRFFVSLPAAEELLAASNAYTVLINAVTEHAIGLSRGSINPPRFFAPEEFAPPIIEPSPIMLERIPPPRPRTFFMPDLVGLQRADLMRMRVCLSPASGTVDACLAQPTIIATDPPGALGFSRAVNTDFGALCDAEIRGRLTFVHEPQTHNNIRSVITGHTPSAGVLVEEGQVVTIRYEFDPNPDNGFGPI